ncbi:hypothetical protein MTR_0008s0030 [Medicago truncatula]|uniref:Uncharacterized protein n=1 Tax=Medicago truncatula TaxID=3880 RepID=A0A072TL05_MEDTR|nr:hypothetical protein MTR_0008s0030 [Medicago truncatula]
MRKEKEKVKTVIEKDKHNLMGISQLNLDVLAAKADAAEIIDVETFQFSYPIATTTSVVINLSDIDYDDDVRILNFVPKNTSFGKRKGSKLYMKHKKSIAKSIHHFVALDDDPPFSSTSLSSSLCRNNFGWPEDRTLKTQVQVSSNLTHQHLSFEEGYGYCIA